MPRPTVTVSPRSPACAIGRHDICDTEDTCRCPCHDTTDAVQPADNPPFTVGRLNATFLGVDLGRGSEFVIADPNTRVRFLHDRDTGEVAEAVFNIKETVYGGTVSVYRVMTYDWDMHLSQILYRTRVQEVSVVLDDGSLHVYTRTEEEQSATYRRLPQE